MISKYVNPFAGLDTGEMKGQINNFIATLNAINYYSSGCFIMDTQAAYDDTFNDAVDKLKTKDINIMVKMCSMCISQVIAKIDEFNSYYDGTYTNDYDSYKTAYDTFINTPEKVTESYWSWKEWRFKTRSVPNPDYKNAEDAKDAAEKVVTADHTKMDTDVGAINSVSF